MLYKLAKVWVLATALSGLCPATQANTTVVAAIGTMPSVIGIVAPATASDPVPRITQNDLALPPEIFGAAPASEAPLSVATATGPVPVRVGLLLPLRSATLGAAAEAVRAGVQAAYEREKDGMSIGVIETDGTAQDVLAAYADAVARFDMVIGPLARSEVAAIAQSGKVSKPSIALARPDTAGDADTVLPPQMLAIGLSIEDEARQVADLVGADKTAGKAFVVSTNVAWQRRAAKAFAAQWQTLGLVSQPMELSISDGYLSARSLVQLKKRLQADSPALLFAALDAGQTAQLRLAIGADLAVYGTSQLNPLAWQDWQNAEPMMELNGARLLDIPWQLQPDHPAVAIYPRLIVGDDEARSADLARLYALGIDAYRVVREIAANRTNFELDGVTGKLTVNFGKGPARFERIEQTAIYQDGIVVPLVDAP